MSTIASRWSSYTPQLRSVLRIAAALMFILFGTMKLFGFPTGMPHGMHVKLLSLIGLAGIIETFGGGLLLLGLFTRPVAFIASGEMAVAYFKVHFPNGFLPTVNGGTNAALFCFIWLYFSAAGAGPWSLDANRRR